MEVRGTGERRVVSGVRVPDSVLKPLADERFEELKRENAALKRENARLKSHNEHAKKMSEWVERVRPALYEAYDVLKAEFAPGYCCGEDGGY